MQYWLDLFTGTTWNEFRKAGATVSGFRARMRKTVGRISPGDILLCYMTGVMRWVGALRVIGPSDDTSHIWSVADFPVRLQVEPVLMLDAETGVPMKALEGNVAFYDGPTDKGKYRGFVRGSPRLFQSKRDGDYVLSLLREAESNPVHRRVDARKWARKPLFRAATKKGSKSVETLVSVPGVDDGEVGGQPEDVAVCPPASTDHTAVQFLLLELGSEMGFNVWVARNDRGKVHNGVTLGSLPRMATELPTQFNEATNKTIELIDVLWLKGNSIVSAFEVECTTAVYSGLLRMSDLLALQPNLNIRLFIVAPEERKAKVEQEILRPTFMLRQKPLAEVCGFLATSDIVEKAEGARTLGLTSSLKPEFLEQMAEYFGGEE